MGLNADVSKTTTSCVSVSIYVSMIACVSACVNQRMCVCGEESKCISTSNKTFTTNTHTLAYIHKLFYYVYFSYTHRHTDIHTHSQTHTHTHTDIHTFTYTHSHTHKLTQTHPSLGLLFLHRFCIHILVAFFDVPFAVALSRVHLRQEYVIVGIYMCMCVYDGTCVCQRQCVCARGGV
jgi:hypothetical protein